MISEPRLTREARKPAGRLSLSFNRCEKPQEATDRWQIFAQSDPPEDGSRRISIRAQSESKTLTVELSAGQAAELMFELGFALEQAARDAKRSKASCSDRATATGEEA